MYPVHPYLLLETIKVQVGFDPLLLGPKMLHLRGESLANKSRGMDFTAPTRPGQNGEKIL